MTIFDPATFDDIPQLADLLAILFTQEADFGPDREKQVCGLRLIVETPHIGQILVARKDCGVVGMVSLLFAVSTAEGGRVCWLEDMIVPPDCRGGGLGSRLLQHAVDFAKASGFTRITLLTDRVNEGALRFYQRHGFRLSEMTVLRRYM